MTAMRVPAFDDTLRKTYEWTAHVGSAMGYDDAHKSYMTLRAVLHALRDRLTPEEAVQLAAQLPMLVRGFYFEGWHPADKPLKYRHKEPFLEQVAREAPWLDGEGLERAVTAGFDVLSSALGRDGEIAQVRDQLPPELRELWAQPVM